MATLSSVRRLVMENATAAGHDSNPAAGLKATERLIRTGPMDAFWLVSYTAAGMTRPAGL